MHRIGKDLTLIGIGLIMGFAFAPSKRDESSSSAEADPAKKRSDRPASVSPAGETQADHARGRRQGDEAADRISISKDSFKKLFAGSEIAAYQPFGHLSLVPTVSTGMTILEVPQEQRNLVIEALTDASSQLRNLERSVEGIRNADHQLTVDLNPLKKPVASVIRETQQKIRSAVEPPNGDLLADSINWKSFYLPGEDWSIRYSLERKPDGDVIARATTSDFEEIRYLPTETAAGTKVKATDAFPSGWVLPLETFELTPANPR